MILNCTGIGRGWRRLCVGLVALIALAAGLLAPHPLGATQTLRFAVGPFQATPDGTRKLYEPFFKQLAEKLGVTYEFAVTNDWAGIATALAKGQADIAWMEPWAYVLANHEGGAQAVATVKYDGQPISHAVILGRPDLEIRKWPDDAEGLSLSLAEVGSTSGRLIPTWWFKAHGIDPKTFFNYRDGASHPANVMAVSNGQVDLAADDERNFNSMVERGLLDKNSVKLVWTSDPLPNDALVVRKDLDPAIVEQLKIVIASITDEEAKAMMPPHYTGWAPATHESYKMIEDADIAVGKIKPKAALTIPEDSSSRAKAGIQR